MESGPTQAVLPLVGLAAEKVIRDRYTLAGLETRPIGLYSPDRHRSTEPEYPEEFF
ncbi:MAG: hypothetical protein ACQESR_08215 [Planctomycetota bacterium]